MDPTRTLIIYYSRTGTTRDVAKALGSELGCKVEEIVDRTPRGGLIGYVRCSIEAMLKQHSPLGFAPMTTDPSDYDLVIVGSPIWDQAVSSPVRTYLDMYRDRIRQVAFFCTYGGTGSARALAQMEEVCGKRPVATWLARAPEVPRPDFVEKVRAFISALKAAPPAESAGPLPKLQPVTS